MKQGGLRGTDISPGQPLPVGGGERCELGDGLSGTAFLVDWRGDGGRDILYSLLPNMHRGGVYLYRERRADRAAVPVLEAGPLVRYRDGNLVRGCGPGGLWGRTVFCACDWDLDGTRDLVAGTVWHNTRLINGHFPHCATPFWLRNTGTDDEPVFERPRLITEADGTSIDLGHHKCSVWCHDLDGDGAPDLICGSEDGKTYAWLRSHLRWDWHPATRFAAGPITTTFGSGLVISVDPRVRE